MRASTVILWTLTALFAAARFLQTYPGKVSMLGVVALHVALPALFALIHGAMFYRVRGMLVFTALCLGVGSMSESLSLRTGFPFGHYYFTDVMGPKIGGLPILLALAYLGMGYLSWTVARLILGGFRLVSLPIVASFVMVAWDFSMDPVWGTIVRAWVWRDGGPYFGVPVSNFIGWFLTVFVFYQLFALYLRRRPVEPAGLPPLYWRMAVVFYGVSAFGNSVPALPNGRPPIVADPAGTAWKVSDIMAVAGLVSVFTMGAFTVMAWAACDRTARTVSSIGNSATE